jgi:gamma-glutamyltranspeptidase/glutathione hydrolase
MLDAALLGYVGGVRSVQNKGSMRKLMALCVALMPSFVVAQQLADGIQPETATPLSTEYDLPDLFAAAKAKQNGQSSRAESWMIAAAHPLAVQAGSDVLRAGGTAADALVAVQTVLGLVEPQSSGLGGGGFLIWYDAKTGALTTLDGRESAPLSATPRLFQNEAGEPLKFFEAGIGGRSVGVPGMPALLQEAHQRWGRQPWAQLLLPATELAMQGFVVSPRLAELVARDAERLEVHESTAAYFLPKGQPLQAGDFLANPAYAETLQQMALGGAGVFYSPIPGSVGSKIIKAVSGASSVPGELSLQDLSLYRIKERAPICAIYRVYEVCGMGPPSSGGLAVGQALGILNQYDLGTLEPMSAEARRLIGEATRLAFADRGRYVADMDFAPVPVRGMLDSSYLAGRAQLIKGPHALEQITPGNPKFDHALLWADDVERARPATTHISIVDRYGNVASMTSSIENAFGSRLMAGGFLLNNQLTDFSFRSHQNGVPIANRVEPGKRSRSSMSPTIVLKDGQPVLVIGSPGGSRIIPYVINAIIAHLDWGMDVQAAVSMPHAVNRFGTYDLEKGTAAQELKPALQAMGYKVNLRGLNSGLHAISIGGGLKGGADPRREGLASGE